MPIMPCICTNPAQDALHGRFMRVWNVFRSPKKPGLTRRCTACGTEVTVR